MVGLSYVKLRPSHFTSPTISPSSGHGLVGHAVLFGLSLTIDQPPSVGISAGTY